MTTPAAGAPSALDVLGPGVLDGLAVMTAGGGWAIADRLERLGARLVALEAELEDEEAVVAAVAAAGRVDVLVADGSGPFGVAGGGVAGLRAAVDGVWNAVRAVACAGWVGEEQPGGKVVLVAPRADGREGAEATGAALENTARTLSIEWARHGVRTTALRPGGRTADAEVAELVAYLASPAGDYLSGCALTTGAVDVVARGA